MESIAMQLVTVRDFIRYGVTQFHHAKLHFGHGSDNALDEATHLVLHVLRMPHDLPGHFMDSRLLQSEKHTILHLFERRVDERSPAAYLTNEAWFAGLSFYVDKRVLVPRSPIAEIIEQRFEPWLDPDGVERILDMCTGSGCIAIAAANAFPLATVDAADLSSDALEVAEINVAQHHMQDRVTLVQSDVFANLAGRHYDLIVTNPPYVDKAEMEALPEEFRHEPVLGLAAGDDGLAVIEQILRHAAEHLTPDGILVAEVGASEQALTEKYPEIPFMWYEFAQGGSGVFVLSREQLTEYGSLFKA